MSDPASAIAHLTKAEAEELATRLKKAKCDHCGEPWYEFDEFESRKREE